MDPLAIRIEDEPLESGEPRYGAAGFSADALEALEALEQGVIFWSVEHECEFVTVRASELLELGYQPLTPGETLVAFMDRCVALGGMDAQTRDGVVDNFTTEDAFSYTQVTHSGAVILVSTRRRPEGGWASTLTNITEFQEAKGALAAARQRADEIEKEMTAELERLMAEKGRVEARQAELKRLSLVAAHAKDLIVITDQSYRIVWANEAYRRHNGFDLELDLVNRSNRDILIGAQTDPEQLAIVDEAVRDRQTVTVDLFCYRRHGEPYWMEQEIIPVFDENGAHTNFIVVGRDISERKNAESQADEAAQFEVEKQAEWRILSEFNEWLQSSDSLEEVFTVVSSFLSRLLQGSAGAVYTFSDDRDKLQKACQWGDADLTEDFAPSDCWALRRGRPFLYGQNIVDIPCRHLNEEFLQYRDFRNICVPIIAHGDTVGLLSVTVQLGALEETRKLAVYCAEHISLSLANVRLREQLRDQSIKDALTGLHNRRFFQENASKELGRCIAQGKPISLVSFDVDHFKKFNDTYGHDAGDRVLRTLADVMRAYFRKADTPCRVGGEEFIVMLSDVDHDSALKRAEGLRAAVEAQELSYNGVKLHVTISIGVATCPDHGATLEELTHAADLSLYVAKNDGRNCVRSAD